MSLLRFALVLSMALAGETLAETVQVWIPYQSFTQTRVDVGGGDQAIAYESLFPYAPDSVVIRVAGVKVLLPTAGWTATLPVPPDLDRAEPLTCFAHISHPALGAPRTLRWTGTLRQHATGGILDQPAETRTSFGNAGDGSPDEDRTVGLATAAAEYLRTGPLGWPGGTIATSTEFIDLHFFPTLHNAGVPPGNPAWLGTGTEWIWVLGMECSYTAATAGP